MPLRDRKRTAPPRDTRPRQKLLEEPVVDLATLKQPPHQRPHRDEEPGELDLPQAVQLAFQPYRAWDPGSLLNVKIEADSGQFERMADLIESMLADTVIAGSLALRVNGLAGLPMRYIGGDEAVIEALSEDYWIMEGAGEQAFRRIWGLMSNLVPVYVRELVEVDGRMVPRLEPWNPRWLTWQWTPEGTEYYIMTGGGRIRLKDQPGRWFLYSPLGFAGGRPWVNGLWYSLATWWLSKSYAIADLAAFGQSHATPKWFLKQIEGTMEPGSDKEAAKRSAIRFLSKIPERSGMYVPYGFEIQQEETTSTAWQAITTQIGEADKALTKAILGSDAGTTANATYASAYTGDAVRWDLMISDTDADAAFLHDGPITLWHGLNFRGTKQLEAATGRVIEMLQDGESGVYRQLAEAERRLPRRSFLRELTDRVRSGDEVPWPTRDATPPEDLAKIAQTQASAADAIGKLIAAATDPNVAEAVAKIDMDRHLARYFPMKGQEGSGVQMEEESPAEGDGVQLSLTADEIEEVESAGDGGFWLLAKKAGKGMTGSGWITVNGTHIHATPGKAIDFKNIKASNSAAPKKPKADEAQPIDLNNLSSHRVEHTNSRGDKLAVTATTSFIPNDKIGFINTTFEYEMNGERMIYRGTSAQQGGVVVLQKQGQGKKDQPHGFPLAKKKEAEKGAIEAAHKALPKEWKDARDAQVAFETDYSPSPQRFNPRYAGTEDEHLFANPRYEQEKDAWAKREVKRQAAIDTRNKLFDSDNDVAKALKGTHKSSIESAMNLDDGLNAIDAQGPTLMLQSHRDVRQHLHDGLMLVDETVEQLQEQNPTAMDDITGQILRVLSDAKDYSDARKRLQAAFPTMDRAQLRNVLTGGLLMAQAAGRYTVQQEVEAEHRPGSRSLSNSEGGLVELDKGKTGSGWITINGTHIHAVPGQAIDFGRLKRGSGGKSATTTEWTKDGLGYTAPQIDAENLAIDSFDRLPKYKSMAGKTPNGESDEDFKKHTLDVSRKATKEQRDAIKRFTDEGDYTVIRSAQRAKDADEFADHMIAAAQAKHPIPPQLVDAARNGDREALKKAYNGAKKDGETIEAGLGSARKSPGRVFRGLSNLNDHEIAKMMSDDTIEFAALSSTSRSQGVSDMFFANGSRSALLVLHQKSGVPIESISKKKGEMEVLVPKGTKFKVVKRYQRTKGIGGNVQKQLVMEAVEID